MTALTLNTKIPNLMAQFGFSKSEVEKHLEEWLVLSLFTQERISSGKSAELLGMSRMEFLKLLHRYHINYFNFTDEELSEEFAAVKTLTVNSQ
jgi:predicted HTH domain antitoxin